MFHAFYARVLRSLITEGVDGNRRVSRSVGVIDQSVERLISPLPENDLQE